MFCPRCATQNADDARYCRGCGVDISLVPQAVTGALAERLAAVEENDGRRRRHKQDGPPTIEKVLRNLFTGIAFIVIAFAIGMTSDGFAWSFWLLIPAAAMLSKAVTTYLRLQEEKKRRELPSYVAPPAAVAPPRPVSALPRRETGEVVPPPSVTEGTTRHLGVPVERKPGE